MKVELKIQTAIKKVIVTDEHSASSYGIPAAVVEGVAYGPNDLLPIWPDDELSWLNYAAKTVIAAACLEMSRNGEITEEEIAFVRKFYL